MFVCSINSFIGNYVILFFKTFPCALIIIIISKSARYLLSVKNYIKSMNSSSNFLHILWHSSVDYYTGKTSFV